MRLKDYLLRSSQVNVSMPNAQVPRILANVEFAEDVSPMMHSDEAVFASENGVRLLNLPDMIKIEYTGLLAKNGANEVYAVIGYRNNRNWDDTEYFPMQKTSSRTFELLTPKKMSGNINIAFKDNANNWDNNSGLNYVFVESSGKSSH